jgi:signal transduction histidine kinase
MDLENRLASSEVDSPTPSVEEFAESLQIARLEALAEFAAGAGHEINNPLAAISGRAQLLLRGETNPEKRRHLLTIGAQALRIRDMIGDLMLFARPPAPVPAPRELSSLVSSMLGRFDEAFHGKSLQLRQCLESEVPIWADETQLTVVVSELLRNAIQWSPTGGTVEVTTCRHADEGPQWACLIVRDEGPGLSARDREHLFDPFYSGRQAGRGLGFGLPKCWRLVNRHGGRIRVDEKLEHGFGMRLLWPGGPPEAAV